MKKAFIAILALCSLALAPQAHAQQYFKQYHPNEISASYGFSVVGSAVTRVINMASVLSEISETELALYNTGTKGWITLGYTYQLNKTISVGLNVGYYNVGVKLKDETGSVTSSANIVPILATGKFDWFRTRSDKFGMYSKIGLGVMAMGGRAVEDEILSGTIWAPSFHVSLIGLEVGRGFSGFFELGAGMQGLAQLGVRARF